jgi:hypothetical protein
MVSVFVVPVVCLNRSSPYFFQKLSIASLSVYDVAGWIKSTAPAVEPGRSLGWGCVVGGYMNGSSLFMALLKLMPRIWVSRSMALPPVPMSGLCQ